MKNLFIFGVLSVICFAVYYCVFIVALKLTAIIMSVGTAAVAYAVYRIMKWYK